MDTYDPMKIPAKITTTYLEVHSFGRTNRIPSIYLIYPPYIHRLLLGEVEHLPTHLFFLRILITISLLYIPTLHYLHISVSQSVSQRIRITAYRSGSTGLQDSLPRISKQKEQKLLKRLIGKGKGTQPAALASLRLYKRPFGTSQEEHIHN